MFIRVIAKSLLTFDLTKRIIINDTLQMMNMWSNCKFGNGIFKTALVQHYCHTPRLLGMVGLN